MPAGFKRFSLRLPCGLQQKDPASCRAINVCVTRASNPAFVGEGLKPLCSNQSANESGIIIRADSSTRATIPFILANLLSQSLFPRAGFPLELSRKHRRAHLLHLPKVHYVDTST
ncbi:hypothetical protein GA612_00510 [Bifidobacterium adolescentis]|nr:hypothetical protein GA612_00510 [Bifidobacterium adolescentis]KAB5912303.1 hypothetical protein GA609_06755 [Bifidobacterium adolescentis]KAB5916882.1 hypothetical protein GA614_07890 [Bifidobacterium adolescentis]KAB5917038.1 hypothetical protein GA613_05745 [Bifidobacterium adolescentis]